MKGVRINYTRNNRPTSAVINGVISQHYGKAIGISQQDYGEDYETELKNAIQKFVYDQIDLVDRSDIEQRLLKAAISSI